MKRITPKTPCLLWVSMILIMSLAISCKKNSQSDIYIPISHPAPGPVEITYYYPNYGIPGDTITMVGKNLKTTKYISFDGIPATSYKVVQDTLKAVLGPFIGDSSTVKRGLLEIQSDSSGNLIFNNGSDFLYYPSRIEGFVASWELLQKFDIWQYNTFDQNDITYYGKWQSPALEAGASFSKGIIGNSLELKNGYFKTVIFDYSQQQAAWNDWGDPNINCCDPIAMNSFSLSFWIRASSSPNSVASLIQVVGDKTEKIWGPVQLGAAMGYTGDTLALETRLTGAKSDGTIVEDYNNPDPRNNSSVYIAGAGIWNHIVYTYNDTTRTVSLFSNGVLISGRILQNFEKPFSFSNENIYLLLGSPAFQEIGFMHSDAAKDHPLNVMGITASIDELALLYNALTAKDILTLYHLGKAGR